MPRGRKPYVNPLRRVHINIDEKLMEEVDRLLWSEAEQCVPYGAFSKFVTEGLVRLLRQRPLDLSPYLGSMPSEHVLYAFPGTIDALRKALEDKEK